MVQRTEGMVPYQSSMAHDRAENGVAMLRVEALWRALDMINPA